MKAEEEDSNGMTEAIRPTWTAYHVRAQPEGIIMCNGGGAFSQEEVEYLRTLPAVAEATTRRITYTESFKHNCVRRYRSGESPVEIFREVGLDPSLIGHKRIERCLARWRGMRCRMGTDDLVPMENAAKTEVMKSESGLSESESGTAESESLEFEESESLDDVRDLLIVQQARRIRELECEVRALQVKASRR